MRLIPDPRHRPLLAILGVAFILRIAGISYGLPLWLVGDEASSIFGALKMIELRTFVPSLHQSVFAGTFYYGAYLPYAYLLPFLAAMGLKFLAFSGTFAEFKHFLISDASLFFFIARSLSACIGTATVYVVYRAAQELYQDQRAALASAALLAFSLLHVDFSHWARHWVPVTFCFSLVLLMLAHRDWSVGKRYIFASLVAGMGVGISIQAGLAAFMILPWFFFVDRLSIRQSLQETWFWKSAGGFLVLMLLAFLLWTKSFDFLFASGSTEAARLPKTVSGLITYYGFHARNLLTREPLFLLCILIGAGAMFKRMRGLWISLVGFVFIYLTIFYMFFSRFDRSVLMLYPVFALLAGYGLMRMYTLLAARVRWLARAVVLLVVLQMAASAVALDARLIRNDTRLRARQWVEAHVPHGAKIAVLSSLVRLPKLARAVDEQERLNPPSIRSVDRAERALPDRLSSPRFHAVEFSAAQSPDVVQSVPEYLIQNEYEYLIVSPGTWASQMGDVVAEFHGYAPANKNGSLTEGFGDGFQELFSSSPMGPDIIIRKLR